MKPQTLWRYLAGFLALNVAFAAAGLLWQHPAGVVAWWVGWLVADVVVLSAFAMAGVGRPLQLTWDSVLTWVFICLNVLGLVALGGATIATTRCHPSDGPPEACGVSFLLVLIPIGLMIADLVLGAIWAIGRLVRNATRVA
jgi:hypothetical protein